MKRWSEEQDSMILDGIGKMDGRDAILCLVT